MHSVCSAHTVSILTFQSTCSWSAFIIQLNRHVDREDPIQAVFFLQVMPSCPSAVGFSLTRVSPDDYNPYRVLLPSTTLISVGKSGGGSTVPLTSRVKPPMLLPRHCIFESSPEHSQYLRVTVCSRQAVLLVNNMRAVTTTGDCLLRVGDIITFGLHPTAELSYRVGIMPPFPDEKYRVDCRESPTAYAHCHAHDGDRPGLLAEPAPHTDVKVRDGVDDISALLESISLSTIDLVTSVHPASNEQPAATEAPVVAPAKAFASSHMMMQQSAEGGAVPPNSVVGSIPKPFQLSVHLLCMDGEAKAYIPVVKGEKVNSGPLGHLRISIDQLITARGQFEMNHRCDGDTPLVEAERSDVDAVAALRFVEALQSRYQPAANTFSPAQTHATHMKHWAKAILTSAKATLQQSDLILQLAGPVWCCGDLHGSFADLKTIVSEGLPFGQVKLQTASFLFLGDYVDRGEHSVEVMLFLLAWKIHQPSRVFLLRGNHEDPAVNGDEEQYGEGSFRSKCVALFGRDFGTLFWEECNEVFALLPVAAVLDRSVFACHGGVPRLTLPLRNVFHTLLEGSGCASPAAVKFRSLMPTPSECNNEAVLRRICREIVWNDPSPADISIRDSDGNAPRALDACEVFDELGFRSNIGRGDTEGVILEFSSKAVDDFLGCFGWSMLLRAHQHKSYGIEVTNSAKVVTLFSSCNYSGENAAGACLVSDGKVHLVSWRRSPLSPPRSHEKPLVGKPQLLAGKPTEPSAVAGIGKVPLPQWSCGLLPCSVGSQLPTRDWWVDHFLGAVNPGLCTPTNSPNQLRVKPSRPKLHASPTKAQGSPVTSPLAEAKQCEKVTPPAPKAEHKSNHNSPRPLPLPDATEEGIGVCG